MTAAVRTTVVGVFEDRKQAEEAVADLRRAGIPDDKIGFVATNPAGPTQEPPAANHPQTHSHLTQVGEGAATGVVAGGTIGTIAGLVVAVGWIPAVGPIIAGGILAGILASLAAGAIAGGVVGTLVALGIPEEDAGHYEQELKAGRLLVTVQADGHREEAVRILRNHGAYGKGSPLI